MATFGGCLLGITPAQALAPFCGCRDLLAWAAAHRASHGALANEGVWRELLTTHFAQGLRALAAAIQPADDAAWKLDIEKEHIMRSKIRSLLVRIPRGSARQVYAQVSKVNARPFILEPRARLHLEIMEVRDWDRQQKRWLLLKQAKTLAGLVELQDDAKVRLTGMMTPALLDLLALQTVATGRGHSISLPATGPPSPGAGAAAIPNVPSSVEALVGLQSEAALTANVEWSPEVEMQFHNSVKALLHRRRMWWQQQRSNLLEDLGITTPSTTAQTV